MIVDNTATHYYDPNKDIWTGAYKLTPNTDINTLLDVAPFAAATEAPAAVKFDTGKTNWALMPWEALEEVVKVLEFGAKKYNEPGDGLSSWNWAKAPGLGKFRTISAVFRHLTSYISGETKDPESGLNHLAHACCGILFLLYYHKHPDKYGKSMQE